jgi:hypothetical protein
MTAFEPATIRDQLASALQRHQATRGMRVSMGWTCACGWWSDTGAPTAIVKHQSDALAPLVERIAAERAAEERSHFTTAMADLLRLTYSVQLDSYPSKASQKESERVADAFRARIFAHCRDRDTRARDRAAVIRTQTRTDREGDQA